MIHFRQQNTHEKSHAACLGRIWTGTEDMIVDLDRPYGTAYKPSIVNSVIKRTVFKKMCMENVT